MIQDKSKNVLINWELVSINPNDKKWNKFSYLFFVMLLYDTLSDLFYNIFPPLKFVNHELHIKKGLPTVKYYIHRIFNLAFKRKLV